MEHPELQLTIVPACLQAIDLREHTFTFLNRTKSFGAGIDWAFQDFGLLWSFHLHYFGWLSAFGITKEKGLDILLQYVENYNKGYFFEHSYVASYRLVNWMRFCLDHSIREERIFASLYRQSQRLAAFPEYELMGNHLLENGIALVWAGLFFGDGRLQEKGERILLQQFPVQVLSDGAHFEKSYAYHTVLLKRLLELAGYYGHFSKETIFYKQLIDICSRMLSYVFVLNNGNNFPPMFGDSNEGMYIPFADLKNLAQNLLLKNDKLPLGESGIRRLDKGACTLFFNLGNITASAQPGHTHADAFTFCLNVGGLPVLVDPGVSTYEAGAVRQRERATAGHNTICVAGADSAEVWASFRIGRRADCICLSEDFEMLDCEHDGYLDDFSIMHRRMLRFEESTILI
ncbi:MAG: alginate lyase family protein, partial [Chitinophagaceae bacterium]|nr:alginate lyase family protein [Chitinophagaceae bacterium]